MKESLKERGKGRTAIQIAGRTMSVSIDSHPHKRMVAGEGMAGSV
jgi:hypothetical protein